jgi:N-acetylmuramoyl-L-alanine amidase
LSLELAAGLRTKRGGILAVPFSFLAHVELRRGATRFDMLLHVRKVYSSPALRPSRRALRPGASRVLVATVVFTLSALLFCQFASSTHNTVSAQSAIPASQTPQNNAAPSHPPNNLQANVLNTVVLDPAHGGTDPGARGTGGIRESEVVLEFAAQIRRALESQGLQVVQTRLGDENPSFDDRSAMANAQRGAVFVTIHIASTGLPSTARVYTNSDLPPLGNTNGLIPWDQAQSPFLGLSRILGDAVQSFLAQRFKGSPNEAQSAAVRQLRTTAAPAIAVEISSVSLEKREELDRMAPGVADAIARGIVAFKPSYVVPSLPTPTQSLSTVPSATPATLTPGSTARPASAPVTPKGTPR